MDVESRRNRLLELVRSQGFAGLPNLSDLLKVSESTVRRDLDFLEQQQVVRRTHGGVFYTGPSPKLPHFDLRQKANWKMKQAIARSAVALIGDGETVLLDGGSTTYELAQLLVGQSVQVVTNSLPVGTLFAGSDTADLVMVGGYVHARTGVLLGPYANQMLAELKVQKAVLSVAGMNENGFYNSNLLLVETERAMMAAADEVMVLVDSTKFDRSSLAHLCDLDDIDTLVVDDQVTDAWQQRLQDAGVNVVIAPSKPAEA
ncbi:MAG: DeoR/GlpR family DNA-binding transcription regulator [Pirellulaceae bacterium]